MCGEGKGIGLCEEEDPSHGTAGHGVAQHAAPLQERREKKGKERGHDESCLYGLAVGLRDGVDL
jgi:hypothetical protein